MTRHVILYASLLAFFCACSSSERKSKSSSEMVAGMCPSGGPVVTDSESEKQKDAVVDAIPAIEPSMIDVGTSVLASGMVAPVAAAVAPGDDAALYVAEQTGPIWRVDVNTGTRTMFKDTSSLLVTVGQKALGGYDERGLLGIAFHPDYAKNGLFYTYTSEPARGTADFTYDKSHDGCDADDTPDHQNVIREWPSGRALMRVDWPGFNHDGGAMQFGKDGMLYVSLGDGGGEDDQTCQIYADGRTTIGHGKNGNGQNLGVVYGKMLRIDPMARTSANGQYGVPKDNPFVHGEGAVPEIWAYGLRNMWKFSLDDTTGTMIGVDVGNNAIEEIDILRAGANYGWRTKEGTALFDIAGTKSEGDETDGYDVCLAPGFPAGMTDPIAQYGHKHDDKDQGSASIGGFVYRGKSLPELAGKYVFADYSADEMKPEGRLLYLDMKSPSLVSETVHDLRKLDVFILGMARDAKGELYVLDNKMGIPAGQTGEVRKLTGTGTNGEE